MRRIFVIFIVGLSSLVVLPYCLIASSSEPYMDDSYYWPVLDSQSPDTVRMRIIDR